MSHVSRRRFLGAMGLTAVAAAAGGGVYLASRGTGSPATVAGAGGSVPGGQGAAGLAATVGDVAAAARIGAVYVEDHPDAPALRAPGAEPAGRRGRHDFEAGNVATVDGWVLPRYVAELCALAHRAAA